MRNADVETLEKVADALENYLPCGKLALLTEFLDLYTRLKSKNDKEKQHYQDNAQHYRDTVKQWKEANPKKQAQYSREYQERKKKAKGKTPKE